MTNFTLLTINTASGPRAAISVAGAVHDLAAITGQPAYSSVLGALEDWSAAKLAVDRVLASGLPSAGTGLDDTLLPPPVLYPSAVYCAGANFSDHIANMEKRLGLEPSPSPRANGGKPFHFLKASRCCVGAGASVAAPSKTLDWEGELVAVIGAEARDVSVEKALDCVAGYSVGNDLSARDIAFRPGLPADSIFRHSWIDHKSFQDAAPVGPWIAPACQVGDPQDLRIRTWVNDVLKQDSSTALMIFSVAEQIAYLSTVITLRPGDLVFTGTPAGVGAESGEHLSPGDTVTVEIEKVGRLQTRIC